METLTTQAEAIILKGIAQQILQMNVPSIHELNKMLREFEYITLSFEERHQIQLDAHLTDAKVHGYLIQKYLNLLSTKVTDDIYITLKISIERVLEDLWVDIKNEPLKDDSHLPKKEKYEKHNPFLTGDNPFNS